MTMIDILSEKARLASPFGGVVLLDIQDGNTLKIDGRSLPVTVAVTDDKNADAIIHLSAQTLSDLLAGRQNPTVAFMTGKLKVTGAMGMALRLAAIIED
jgi:putative sterol carrier protein